MIQVRWAQTDLPDFVTHPLYPGVNPTDNNLLGEGLAPTTAGNNLAARQVSSGFNPGVSDFTERLRDSTTATGSPTRGSGGDDDRPSFPTFRPPGSSPAGKGLSTGAKAGIGVAVPVVLLTILGVIGFFWRKHRKDKMNSPTQSHHPPTDPSAQPWAQPQMTSQGGRLEMPADGGTPVTMPQSAMTNDEKPELSSNQSYRGSQGLPAELHTQGHNQQPFAHHQHSELPGISSQSPHHRYGELSGTTTQYSHPAEMDNNQYPVQVPSPTYQTPSPGLQAPTAPPPISKPPAAAVQTQMQAEPSADELMQQKARLEERRQRLLELERIEHEQEELQRRIKAQGGS